MTSKRKRQDAIVTLRGVEAEGKVAPLTDFRAERRGERQSVTVGPRPPRGQNRLYREVLEILESRGVECSAHDVRTALIENGIVERRGDWLHWTADNGAPKKTHIKQFDSSLSRHRAALRDK
jgi:hypothetical protein